MLRIVSCALLTSLAIFLTTSSRLAAADKNPKNPESTAAAREQVAAALRAEIAGENDRRADLLNSAARTAPELPDANWHLARVQIGGKWVTLDEAQQEAANDQRLTEYRKLRDEAADNPKLLRGLARWCLKNSHEELARLHYMQLLARSDVDAEAQREAIERLDLRYIAGTWITAEDLKAQEDKAKMTEDAIRKLRPRIKRLQQAVDAGDYALRERAIKELKQIDEPQCIPVLETFLTDGGADFQQAAVEHLARFPDYSASEALVRYAVLSEFVNARDKAIAALKARSKHEYVPLLLSGLVAPIKSQFQIKALANGVITYTHVFTRETPQQKLVAVANNQIIPSFVPRRFNVPKGTRGQILGVVFDDTMWVLENRLAQETMLKARENEIAASLVAQAVHFSNKRVLQALATTTDQQLRDDPQEWWQWWQNYNEYHWPQQTYVSYSNDYARYQTPPPVQVIKGQSCFLAGTLVQTQIGREPIESIRPGDRVLAQDQNTGELIYKLVLRTTLRPPAKMVRIHAGGDEIITTLGHPFWVDGHGWKMAKELKEGDLLHSLGGAVRIDKVEDAGEEKAYNLVVDDFNTYFVGQQGLLVHDNEFRKPTRAIVPGLVDEQIDVVTAAKK
jgi:Pretoxin HINT domain/HEAT repeats